MSLNSLPNTARIWSFLSNRILSDAEEESIRRELEKFVSDWKAHGNDLSAGFEVFDHCVIVVAVDESFEAPSGCSIDKVFRLLLEWSSKNNCDFFQRTLTGVKKGNEIKILKQNEIKLGLENQEINAETLCFNMEASSLGDINSSIYIPLEKTWLGIKLVN